MSDPREGANHWTHRRPELVARGDTHYLAKLRSCDVKKLRRLHGKGVGCVMLGRCFGLNPKTAWEIATRRKWKHIDA